MNIDKELDAVFKKADEAFALADEVFKKAFGSSSTKTHVPVGEVHTDHVQFRATNWQERKKLFWQFFKMAFAVMFKGVAHLKFKSRAK